MGHKNTPPTPCLNVDVYQKGLIKGQVQVLPDCGSVVDIISTDLAQSLGLDLIEVQDSNYQLTAANGQNISVSHEANLGLQFS